MIIGRIAGCTMELGKPADWDDSKGECASLPVRVEQTNQGQCLTSAWYPTKEELALLLAGEPVLLSVFGGHPPVWLRVEKTAPQLVIAH